MTAQKNRKHGVRGFAAMTAEERSAASRLGAEALHARGLAYQWTPEQAAAAARKSVQVRRLRRLERKLAERFGESEL